MLGQKKEAQCGRLLSAASTLGILFPDPLSDRRVPVCRSLGLQWVSKEREAEAFVTRRERFSGNYIDSPPLRGQTNGTRSSTLVHTPRQRASTSCAAQGQAVIGKPRSSLASDPEQT